MNEPPFIVMLLGNVFFGGVLFSFMAIFFYYGPLALVEYFRKISRCRCLVKGTVTNVDHVEDKQLNRPSDMDPHTKFWKPAICYTYNGKEYKATSSVVTSWKRHQVGQEVEIYINEKHPEEYYLRGEPLVMIPGFIICTLLFVATIAGFVWFLWKELA